MTSFDQRQISDPQQIFDPRQIPQGLPPDDHYPTPENTSPSVAELLNRVPADAGETEQLIRDMRNEVRRMVAEDDAAYLALQQYEQNAKLELGQQLTAEYGVLDQLISDRGISVGDYETIPYIKDKLYEMQEEGIDTSSIEAKIQPFEKQAEVLDKDIALLSRGLDDIVKKYGWTESVFNEFLSGVTSGFIFQPGSAESRAQLEMRKYIENFAEDRIRVAQDPNPSLADGLNYLSHDPIPREMIPVYKRSLIRRANPFIAALAQPLEESYAGEQIRRSQGAVGGVAGFALPVAGLAKRIGKVGAVVVQSVVEGVAGYLGYIDADAQNVGETTVADVAEDQGYDPARATAALEEYTKRHQAAAQGIGSLLFGAVLGGGEAIKGANRLSRRNLGVSAGQGAAISGGTLVGLPLVSEMLDGLMPGVMGRDELDAAGIRRGETMSRLIGDGRYADAMDVLAQNAKDNLGSSAVFGLFPFLQQGRLNLAKNLPKSNPNSPVLTPTEGEVRKAIESTPATPGESDPIRLMRQQLAEHRERVDRIDNFSDEEAMQQAPGAIDPKQARELMKGEADYYLDQMAEELATSEGMPEFVRRNLKEANADEISVRAQEAGRPVRSREEEKMAVDLEAEEAIGLRDNEALNRALDEEEAVLEGRTDVEVPAGPKDPVNVPATKRLRASNKAEEGDAVLNGTEDFVQTPDGSLLAGGVLSKSTPELQPGARVTDVDRKVKYAPEVLERVANTFGVSKATARRYVREAQGSAEPKGKQGQERVARVREILGTETPARAVDKSERVKRLASLLAEERRKTDRRKYVDEMLSDLEGDEDVIGRDADLDDLDTSILRRGARFEDEGGFIDLGAIERGVAGLVDAPLRAGDAFLRATLPQDRFRKALDKRYSTSAADKLLGNLVSMREAGWGSMLNMRHKFGAFRPIIDAVRSRTFVSPVAAKIVDSSQRIPTGDWSNSLRALNPWLRGIRGTEADVAVTRALRGDRLDGSERDPTLSDDQKWKESLAELREAHGPKTAENAQRIRSLQQSVGAYMDAVYAKPLRERIAELDGLIKKTQAAIDEAGDKAKFDHKIFLKHAIEKRAQMQERLDSLNYETRNYVMDKYSPDDEFQGISFADISLGQNPTKRNQGKLKAAGAREDRITNIIRPYMQKMARALRSHEANKIVRDDIDGRDYLPDVVANEHIRSHPTVIYKGERFSSLGIFRSSKKDGLISKGKSLRDNKKGEPVVILSRADSGGAYSPLSLFKTLRDMPVNARKQFIKDLLDNKLPNYQVLKPAEAATKMLVVKGGLDNALKDFALSMIAAGTSPDRATKINEIGLIEAGRMRSEAARDIGSIETFIPRRLLDAHSVDGKLVDTNLSKLVRLGYLGASVAQSAVYSALLASPLVPGVIASIGLGGGFMQKMLTGRGLSQSLNLAELIRTRRALSRLNKMLVKRGEAPALEPQKRLKQIFEAMKLGEPTEERIQELIKTDPDALATAMFIFSGQAHAGRFPEAHQADMMYWATFGRDPDSRMGTSRLENWSENIGHAMSFWMRTAELYSRSSFIDTFKQYLLKDGLPWREALGLATNLTTEMQGAMSRVTSPTLLKHPIMSTLFSLMKWPIVVSTSFASAVGVRRSAQAMLTLGVYGSFAMWAQKMATGSIAEMLGEDREDWENAFVVPNVVPSGRDSMIPGYGARVSAPFDQILQQYFNEPVKNMTGVDPSLRTPDLTFVQAGPFMQLAVETSQALSGMSSDPQNRRRSDQVLEDAQRMVGIPAALSKLLWNFSTILEKRSKGEDISVELANTKEGLEVFPGLRRVMAAWGMRRDETTGDIELLDAKGKTTDILLRSSGWAQLVEMMGGPDAAAAQFSIGLGRQWLGAMIPDASRFEFADSRQRVTDPTRMRQGESRQISYDISPDSQKLLRDITYGRLDPEQIKSRVLAIRDLVMESDRAERTPKQATETAIRSITGAHINNVGPYLPLASTLDENLDTVLSAHRNQLLSRRQFLWQSAAAVAGYQLRKPENFTKWILDPTDERIPLELVKQQLARGIANKDEGKTGGISRENAILWKQALDSYTEER